MLKIRKNVPYNLSKIRKESIKYLVLQFLLFGSIFHKVYPIVIACLMKITNGFQIRDEDVIGYKKSIKSCKIFLYLFLYSAFILCEEEENRYLKFYKTLSRL